LKRINRQQWVYILGIGVTVYLIITGFSQLVETSIRELLIVKEHNPKQIMWIPQVLSLVSFVILLILCVQLQKNLNIVNLKRFFITLVLIYLILFIGGIIVDKITFSLATTHFKDIYRDYHIISAEYLTLQRYMLYVSFLKYVTIVLLLFFNFKRPSQIQISNE